MPPSGFAAPHTKPPVGDGTHGTTPPSGAQQSRSFEHRPPALEQVSSAQRGTPSGSSLQIFFDGSGQQSSAFAELPQV
jgi:hypothetical protein